MFMHDLSTCDDVEQLKHSKDFNFMEQFFSQGSPNTYLNGASPTARTNARKVDPFDDADAPTLSEIDRG